MQFEIGQIIDKSSREYSSAAIWCNKGNGILTDLGDGTARIDVVPTPTQEELNAQQVAEIDAELAELDAKSARSMRAKLSGMGNAQDDHTIAIIESRATELRTKRATLAPIQTFNLS